MMMTTRSVHFRMEIAHSYEFHDDSRVYFHFDESRQGDLALFFCSCFWIRVCKDVFLSRNQLMIEQDRVLLLWLVGV